MTIDCLDDELRDLLPGFAHGRLGSVERERVSAHLAGCAACAHELEIIRAARASFARVRPVDTGRIVAMLPSPPGRPALRVERGEGLSVRRGAWSRRSALRIAAGIMVLAVGGVSLKVASESGPGSVAVGDLPSGSSASPAIAFASKVLPVPGGPMSVRMAPV